MCDAYVHTVIDMSQGVLAWPLWHKYNILKDGHYDEAFS